MKRRHDFQKWIAAALFLRQNAHKLISPFHSHFPIKFFSAFAAPDAVPGGGFGFADDKVPAVGEKLMPANFGGFGL